MTIKTVYIFNNTELNDPVLIRLTRKVAREVAQTENLSPSNWPDFLIDLFRDLNAEFINNACIPADLPIHVFDPTDEEIDAGEAQKVYARIADWFAYITSPVANDTKPRLKSVARERFRVLASLLIAAYPELTANWPRIVPANDNFKLPRASNDNDY